MGGGAGRPAGWTRQQAAWMLYDWAASAFATTVLAGFFPVFFKSWWASGMGDAAASALVGTGNSAATLVVLAVALLFGAWADRAARRKGLLLVFCLAGAAATAALPLAGKGQAAAALALFVVAAAAYAGGNVFYDSLLPVVAPSGRRDIVSAGGYAMGYLGGGALFLVNVVMYLRPSLFGLADGAAAVRASFVTVGAWWLLFSLPLLLVVKEPRPEAPVGFLRAARASAADLLRTLRRAAGSRDLLLFLLAFWLYNDAVNTVIKMALAYGADIGIRQADMIKALLMVQFVGFPAAWAFGAVTARAGRRRMLLVAIAAYGLVILYGCFMRTSRDFFLLAGVVALFQGGIQAISRSLYADLIPAGESARWFGLYNVGAHFSTLLGPVAVGWTGYALGSPRLGMLVLLLFLLAGAVLLARVKEPSLPK